MLPASKEGREAGLRKKAKQQVKKVRRSWKGCAAWPLDLPTWRTGHGNVPEPSEENNESKENYWDSSDCHPVKLLMHNHWTKIVLFSISSICSTISIVVPWWFSPITTSSQDMLETPSVQDGHLWFEYPQPRMEVFVIGICDWFCIWDYSRPAQEWDFVICDSSRPKPRGICDLRFCYFEIL